MITEQEELFEKLPFLWALKNLLPDAHKGTRFDHYIDML